MLAERVPALALLALIVAALTACGGPGALPSKPPERLSAWQIFDLEGELIEPHQGSVAYTLNTPLYSDYARKLRTIRLPSGTAIAVGEDGRLEFPAGTVISKTFYYDRGEGEGLAVVQNTALEPRLDRRHVRLIETRLLVRRASGWQALPYVWNAEQTEAYYAPTGRIEVLRADSGMTFPYLVPDRNQCGSCHVTDTTRGAIEPIGPTLANLDGPGADGGNQLAMLEARGWLPDDLPDIDPIADWQSIDAPLEARARAYLAVNCGHCHNPRGAADTSGLFLDANTRDPLALGICKPPIAAGQGTGGRRFAIVPGDADESILIYRMTSTDPGAMMPELGRSLVHREGVRLVSEWIDSLPGHCVSEGTASAAHGPRTARVAYEVGM